MTPLSFLQMTARMGMIGAVEALRQYRHERKQRAVLLSALQNFADAYCPPDGSPLEWEACNSAYQVALDALKLTKVKP